MSIDSYSWIQYLGPPLLMLVGGIITWLIRTKTEELRAVEERLSEERRNIYTKIFEPYIHILSDSSGEGIRKGTKIIKSVDYKKVAFQLNLIGSDGVVRAYNDMMVHAFNNADNENRKPVEMIKVWGNLMLEIRKSLGNKKTELNEFDMFKGMITDLGDVMGKSK